MCASGTAAISKTGPPKPMLGFRASMEAMTLPSLAGASRDSHVAVASQRHPIKHMRFTWPAPIFLCRWGHQGFLGSALESIRGPADLMSRFPPLSSAFIRGPVAIPSSPTPIAVWALSLVSILLFTRLLSLFLFSFPCAVELTRETELLGSRNRSSSSKDGVFVGGRPGAPRSLAP